MIVGVLEGLLTLDASDFQDKLSDAISGLKRSGQDLEKFGDALSGAGKTLTAGITLPLTAAATASTVMASTFDDSMRRLVSIAGVGSDELVEVKQHVLDLAKASGVGPQALADAMTVVSSTMSDTKTAMEVLDIATQGTIAGFGDTKDIARALTAVVNSYGASNLSAAEAGDILAQTIKEGGAEAAELAPTLANVVPVAAQLGIGFDEVGANIATVTKLGTPAAEAVTQLGAVMSALLKPTTDGEAALRSVGLSYEQLRQQVAENGLQATLQSLSEKFKGNETALADVFGRVEAFRNVMASAGAQSETYATVLDRLKESHGSLASMAAAMSGSTSQTWSQLTATVQVIAIKLGDALAPALGRVLEASLPLLDVLESAIDWFSRLPSPVQTGAIALAGIAAVIGPLLVVIGSVVSAVGTLSGTFATLATNTAVVGVLSTIQGALAAVVTVLTGPVGIILAIGAAVTAIIHWTDSWYAVTAVMDAIKGLFSAVWGLVTAGVGLISNLVGSISDWSGAGSTLLAVWDALGSWFRGVFNAIIVDVIDYVQMITDGIRILTEWIDTLAGKTLPPPPSPDIYAKPYDTAKESMNGFLVAAALSGESMEEYGIVAGITFGTVTDGAEKSGAAARLSAQQLEQLAREMSKLSGEDVTSKAEHLVDVVDRMGGVAKLSAEGQREVNAAMNAAIAVYHDFGQAAPAAMLALADATDRAKQNTFEMTGVVSSLPAVLGEWRVAQGEVLLQSSEWAGNLTTTNANITQVMSNLRQAPASLTGFSASVMEAKDHTLTFNDAMTNIGLAMGQAAQRAVEGGGNVQLAMAGAFGTSAQQMIKQYGAEHGGVSQGMDLLGKAAGVAGQAIGAYQEIQGSATQGAAVATGALKGMQIGMQTFGPIGAVVGAGVGALVGAFANLEKKVNDTRDQFVEASGGLDELNKSVFAATGSLDLVKKMLDADTPKKYEEAIKNLKAAIEKHKEELKDWSTELNNVLQNGIMLTEELAKKTVDLFNRDRAGTTQTLYAFLQKEIETVSKSFTDAVDVWSSPLIEAQKNVDKTGKALQDMQKTGKASAEDLAKATKEHEDALRELAKQVEENQDDFSRYGSISVGVFQQLQESGMDAIDALEAMRPALEDLQDASEILGATGSETFQQMLEFSRLADEFEPSLRQIENLDSLMVSLNNTGLLSSSLFYDIAAQITDTFGSMIDQGVDAASAMRMIQPELQDIWEKQHDLGFEVDDATQALLDQAEASGIVGDQFRDAQDRMTAAVERLVTRLGDLITVMTGGIPSAAVAGSAVAANALSGIGAAAQTAAANANAAISTINWGGLKEAGTTTLEGIEDAGRGAAWGNSPTGVVQVAYAASIASDALAALNTSGTGSLRDLEKSAGDAAKKMQEQLSAATALDLFSAAGSGAQSSIVATQRANAVKDWVKSQADVTKMLVDQIKIPVQQSLIDAFTLKPEMMNFDSVYDYIARMQVDRLLKGQASDFASTINAILAEQKTQFVVTEEVAKGWKEAFNTIMEETGDLSSKVYESQSGVFDLLESSAQNAVSSMSLMKQGQLGMLEVSKEWLDKLTAIGEATDEDYNKWREMATEQFLAGAKASVSGFATAVEGLATILQEAQDKQEALTDAQDDYNDALERAKGNQNALKEASLTYANSVAAINSQYRDWSGFVGQNFDTFGLMAQTAFAQARAAGGGFLESLLAIQPQLQTLLDTQNAFGVGASAGLKKLLDLSDVAKKNEPVLNFVAGLDQMLAGLGNTGGMTQDVFNQLAKGVDNAFAELVRGGASGTDAMQMMQPTLQKMWELHGKWGFSIDATTASLLQQASSAGLVGSAFQSAEERIAASVDLMVSKLDVLIDRLASVAASVSVLGGLGIATPNNIPLIGAGSISVKDNSGQLINSLTQANARLDMSSTAPTEWFVGGVSQGYISANKVAALFAGFHQFDQGGYMDFGSGTPAMLHGPEVVMPLDRFLENYSNNDQMIAVVKIGEETVAKATFKRMPRYARSRGARRT